MPLAVNLYRKFPACMCVTYVIACVHVSVMKKTATLFRSVLTAAPVRSEVGPCVCLRIASCVSASCSEQERIHFPGFV